ncbi:small redox-active disulfide protein 2 [Thiothrix caldifontis]|uniref:Small redox-active disulfide protein 2 n=1 Tax=Thiothrix caldifontis TaxID=525918 RepID=A0A1H4GXK2_9GAMM|nr:thioredoxin family protein [Thiothrix caldifontis]SEB13402.1 small redox-active disulfide protein 2 [Thiothrix caldifontis]
MQIKVLGTGCANCKTTFKLIEDMAKEKGVAVEMEKVEDLPSIMGYGVMSTPGVVVDGKVVHAGGIPSKAAIEGWLAGATAAAPAAGGCCSGGKCC